MLVRRVCVAYWRVSYHGINITSLWAYGSIICVSWRFIVDDNNNMHTKWLYLAICQTFSLESYIWNSSNNPQEPCCLGQWINPAKTSRPSSVITIVCHEREEFGMHNTLDFHQPMGWAIVITVECIGMPQILSNSYHLADINHQLHCTRLTPLHLRKKWFVRPHLHGM